MHSNVRTAQPIFLPGFDILRVAAAFAVVYIHGSVSSPKLSNWASWAAFAVPSFFLMAGFLTARGLAYQAHTDFSPFVRARVLRLLPAYLAWSAFYLVLRAFKIGVLQGEGWQAALNINWLTLLLFGGYTYHLWFIPTLLYFSILLYLILCLIKKLNWIFRFTILTTLAIFIFFLYGYFLNIVEAKPGVSNYLTRYFSRNFGFSIFGAALFILLDNCIKWRFIAIVVAVITWIGVILLAMNFYTVETDVLWLPCITLGMFMVILLIKQSGTGLHSRLANVSFGIYLVHAVFLETFKLTLNLFHIPLTAYVTSGLIVLAFVASGIFSLTLEKNSKMQWLVR